MIKIIDLKKIYGNNESRCVALNGINLEINDEKFVAITGKSGSGKSTLINMLGLIDVPTSGKIIVENRDILTFDKKERIKYKRNTVGIVFQTFDLIDSVTCYDNIALALRKDDGFDMEYFENLTDKLDIREQLKKYPDQLSGGQKQRVAIARAMINRPKILLADEPTGNLDSENSRNVIELMKKISAEYGTTIILSTHDEEIAEMSDLKIRISDGNISKSE